MTSHLITAAGIIAESIIKPLRPGKGPWRQVELPAPCAHVELMERWCHPAGYNVLSAVENVSGELPGQFTLQYHISITKFPPPDRDCSRCPEQEALWILSCFGLDGWEEDNHVPDGKARNYWRHVAEPDVGRECPCKESEPVVVEDKGDYIWRPV